MHVQNTGEGTTIALQGTLNDLTVTKLEHAFHNLFHEGKKPKTLYINCQDLIQISSIGLAFLVRTFQVCMRINVGMELTNARSNIRKAFKMIHIGRIMDRLKAGGNS